MPHFTPCPWCEVLIVDWFHEWYPKQQYDEIKLGKLAMDCPHHQCRRPVTLHIGKLVSASMCTSFILTPAELEFLHHFDHECVTAAPGPATFWLREYAIFPTVMQSFQYAEQQSSPGYIDRIMEDPLPPFRPAWSSREEFNARASEIVAVFPELKQLRSALPDFQPNFTPAPEKVSS